MQVYRDVAARHNVILVDGPEVLRASSRHGILDDSVIHDAHHPTLDSHLKLAQAVVDQLYQRRALGLEKEGSRAPSIDPVECASRFPIDSRLWTGVCAKAGTYYKHLASARYDPAERIARQHRFEQAATLIRDGLRQPDQLGIPGIGLPPPASWRWDWWVVPPSSGTGPTRADDRVTVVDPSQSVTQLDAFYGLSPKLHAPL